MYNNDFSGNNTTSPIYGYPVGVDVAGGRQSTIADNVITGGHLGIRLMDPIPGGAYPISNLLIDKNVIYDQTLYDQYHPQWGVKIISDNSDTSATLTNNEMHEEAGDIGIIGGSAATKTTILTIDSNLFVRPGDWWNFYWCSGPLTIYSGGVPIDWTLTTGTNTVITP